MFRESLAPVGSACYGVDGTTSVNPQEILMSDPLEEARKLAEASANNNENPEPETPANESQTSTNETMTTQAVVPLEQQLPANTGYVAPESKPEDEYDKDRDGALDGERRTVSQGFVISTHLDPQRQRDAHGGPYLDDVQRMRAEVVRARAEGREPDFENPGVTAGQVCYPEHVAALHAQPDAKVVPDFHSDVVVGEYQD